MAGDTRAPTRRSSFGAKALLVMSWSHTSFTSSGHRFGKGRPDAKAGVGRAEVGAVKVGEAKSEKIGAADLCHCFLRAALSRALPLMTMNVIALFSEGDGLEMEEVA